MRADFTTPEFAPRSHDALVIAVTEEGGSEIKSRGSAQQSLDSIKVFADDDVAMAKVEPQAHAVLSRFETTATHYKIVDA